MSPAPVGRGANFSSSSMGTVNHGASRRSSVRAGRVIGFCLTIAKRYPTVPSQGDMDVAEDPEARRRASSGRRVAPPQLPIPTFLQEPQRSAGCAPPSPMSPLSATANPSDGSVLAIRHEARTFDGNEVVTAAKGRDLMIDARQKVG